MKYKTVRIIPGIDKGKDKWKVSFTVQPNDRVPTKTQPHPMGFYHYSGMLDKTAFNKLVVCMIEAHEEEIDRLKRSVEALKDLKDEVLKK